MKSSLEEVKRYYLSESQLVIDKFGGNAVVLKTDMYNELNDKPIGGGIAYNLKNYRSICALEYDKKTYESTCHKYLKQKKVKLIHGDIRKLPFVNELNVILDLSTIDHVPPIDLPIVIEGYAKALLPNGILLMFVWCDDQDGRFENSDQYFFKTESVENHLSQTNLLLKRKEDVFPGTLLFNSTTKKLVQFVARKQ